MARILSLVMAAFILAPIVAPSIGAVILTFASWRWIFGFLAIYGAVVLVLAAVFLDETLKVKDPNALDPARLLRLIRGRVPRSAQPLLGRRGHAGTRPAHRLPHQLLGRAHGRLRPDGIAVRRRLRRGRGLLLGRQPVEFAPGPPRRRWRA